MHLQLNHPVKKGILEHNDAILTREKRVMYSAEVSIYCAVLHEI